MGGAGHRHRAGGIGGGGRAVKKKLHAELSEAYPARFPADNPNLETPFQQRERELATLEYDAALSGEYGEKHATQRADINRVLVAMMVPPALRAGDPSNAVLALERTFERQAMELSTHCNVTAPEALSVYSFMARCDYFEELMEAKQKG